MTSITNTARKIVASPENHLHDPSLFSAAWASMKAARGQGFDPARLRAAHLIDHPGPTPEPTGQTLDRVAAKVREIAEQKGYQTPQRHVA